MTAQVLGDHDEYKYELQAVIVCLLTCYTDYFGILLTIFFKTNFIQYKFTMLVCHGYLEVFT